MRRVDYTVAMLVNGKFNAITSPNLEVIHRIWLRWCAANPNREVTLFANLYV